MNKLLVKFYSFFSRKTRNKIGKIKLINVEYPQGYTVAVKKKDEAEVDSTKTKKDEK